MSQPFEPLIPDQKQDQEFAPEIVSTSDVGTDSSPDGIDGSSPSAQSGPGTPGGACEPSIELKKDGDTVSAIQIRCSCGQVIELACQY